MEALGFLRELCMSKQIRKPALLAAAKKVSSKQVLLSSKVVIGRTLNSCERSNPVELLRSLLLQHICRVSSCKCTAVT